MSRNPTHYDVLGVAETASAEEIKRQWRSLARSLHPDLRPGDAGAEATFKAAAAAWEILGDADRRAAYDKELQAARAPACTSCGRPASPGSPVCGRCLAEQMAPRTRPRNATPPPRPRPARRPTPRPPQERAPLDPEAERLAREYGPTHRSAPPPPPRNRSTASNAPRTRAVPRNADESVREAWARQHQPTGEDILESLLGESATRAAEQAQRRAKEEGRDQPTTLVEGRFRVTLDGDIVSGIREFQKAAGAANRLVNSIRRFFPG